LGGITQKINMKIPVLVLWIITIISCNSQQQTTFIPKEVYKSNSLVVKQITENSFQHISYKQTTDFGNVPCNGLIVRDNNEVIIFDTPTSDSSSTELITWVTQTLHGKINAIIPTHFHDDCLGGLNAFHQNNIPSYAYFNTITLAKENGLAVPQHSFTDSLVLKVGDEKIIATFFGEGHTKDNIVGYFPSENVLFGGCLIKELDANKGYLGDANIAAWPSTVKKVKEKYPNLQMVVPGHGAHGNNQLLDYTIQLFKDTLNNK
jgi:metallo-beta-lactamase class B